MLTKLEHMLDTMTRPGRTHDVMTTGYILQIITYCGNMHQVQIIQIMYDIQIVQIL